MLWVIYERNKWLPWENKKYLGWNKIEARGIKLKTCMVKHSKKRHTKSLSFVLKIQSWSRNKYKEAFIKLFTWGS